MFKIDTKEKFTIITPLFGDLSDNLTATLVRTTNEYLQSKIKNIVLNLQNVQTIDEAAAIKILELQQSFYDNNASFVICDMQKSVQVELDQLKLLERMNITPSESEAWDIIQMEEIERELTDNNNPTFNNHKKE